MSKPAPEVPCAHSTRHAEAFAIMHYRCEGCGKIEMLWNSRDGVTPFMVASQCCDKQLAQHLMLKDVKTHLPPLGVNRVFIDLTEAKAVEYAKRRFKDLVDNDYYGQDHLCDMTEIKAVQNALDELTRQPGQPDTMTLEEYNARDSSEAPTPGG